MEKALIPRCLTCKYWKQKTNYEHVDNTGICTGMNNDSLFDVNLHTGWDGGYVESIETDQKFGCVQHESKIIEVEEPYNEDSELSDDEYNKKYNTRGGGSYSKHLPDEELRNNS